MNFLMYFFTILLHLVNINCQDYYTTTDYNISDEIDEIDYQPNESIFNLVRGSSVDMWVSPENVVYCKLISPRGIVSYDNFGRCRLSLDRVVLEHHGIWEKHVGYPGSANLKVQSFNINVIEQEPKTKVHTAVEESSPNIIKISCSLPSGYQVRGCKFRGPQDLTLVASGTTEDIVNYDDTGFESRLLGPECSLQMINPRVRDLGFWRCAMYTEQDIYYGFVTVLTSWFLNETTVVESIRRGPVLRADHRDIDVYIGEPVTMSCSIDAPIRYCYFWMGDRDNMVTVYPGLNSSSMEYVGLGFDAGECGLKLHDYQKHNGRRWRCNIALATGSQQHHDFYVYSRDRMKVSQENVDSSSMVLIGRVDNSTLEYCRYMQNDGVGFSYDNAPSRFEFTGSLSEGSCALQIRYPAWSDYNPWTIVAKVKGTDKEISGRTWGAVRPYEPYQYDPPSNGWQIFGWVVLSVVIAGFLLAVSLGPQRNRQWVASRATIVRQSLRRQPPPPYTPTI